MDELKEVLKAEYNAIQNEINEGGMDDEEYEKLIKQRTAIVEQWNKLSQAEAEAIEKKRASRLTFIAACVTGAIALAKIIADVWMFIKKTEIQVDTINRGLKFEEAGNILVGDFVRPAVKKAIDG